jgi:hypothetical protein
MPFARDFRRALEQRDLGGALLRTQLINERMRVLY